MYDRILTGGRTIIVSQLRVIDFQTINECFDFEMGFSDLFIRKLCAFHGGQASTIIHRRYCITIP